MRFNLAIGCVLLSLTALQAQEMKYIQKKTFVKGVVIEKMLDCSDQQEAPLDKRSVKRFKVFKGKKYRGQEAQLYFKTSDEGKFIFEIEPGTYSIVEADRPEKYTGRKKDGRYLWNSLCLNSKWSEPLVTFEVELSDPIEIEVVIERSE